MQQYLSAAAVDDFISGDRQDNTKRWNSLHLISQNTPYRSLFPSKHFPFATYFVCVSRQTCTLHSAQPPVAHSRRSRRRQQKCDLSQRFFHCLEYYFLYQTTLIVLKPLLPACLIGHYSRLSRPLTVDHNTHSRQWQWQKAASSGSFFSHPSCTSGAYQLLLLLLLLLPFLALLLSSPCQISAQWCATEAILWPGKCVDRRARGRERCTS